MSSYRLRSARWCRPIAMLLASAAAAAAATVVMVAVTESPVLACPPDASWCVGDGKPGDRPGPPPGPNPGDQPAGCGYTWRNFDPPADPSSVRYYNGYGPPPAGTVVQWQGTLCRGGPGDALAWYLRWIETRTPEMVARDIWVEVSGTLDPPTVQSDPPAGVNAIISIPVFVEVTNWTGTLTPGRCESGFCVDVTVTPTLTYNPGEPGSPVKTCAGNGSRYDQNGPDIHIQALAPGSCAYAYQQRTGVAGRPEVWPAAVSVTWSFTWTSTVGNNGTLPAVTRTAPVPRGVDEVQSVVVD